MSRIPLLTLFASVVALGTGCYTEGDGYGYAQPVYAQPGGPGYADGAPAVGYVSVAPGVEVVSDYDYPVFFTGGLYWRSFGGVWYSSGMYNGGWAINYNVPIGVRGIARPEMYAHYHPAGASIRYSGGAGFRGGGYVGGGVRGGAYVGGGVRGGAAVTRPVTAAPAAHPAAPAARPAPARRK
jgi:hypothetical protein